MTTTAKPEGTPTSEREHYAKEAKLLLAQMVKVRRKAASLGQKPYVSALNSFIRTVAQLLRAIGRSKFDKSKVGRVLKMLKKKVEDMDADLDQKVTTEAITRVRPTVSVIKVRKLSLTHLTFNEDQSCCGYELLTGKSPPLCLQLIYKINCTRLRSHCVCLFKYT